MSLTAWLRERSDDQLAQLLRRRPDLCLPAPADLAALAGRLSVRSSVQRAIDGLNAFTVRILEGLVLTATAGNDAVHPSAVAALLLDADDEPGRDAFAGAIAELLELALIWGSGETLHLVAAVSEAVGTYPAGLGRPAAQLLRSVSDVQLAPALRNLGLAPTSQPGAGQAIAAVLARPDRVAELLAACSPAEREILELLAVGPPVGTVRNAQRPVAAQDPSPPSLLMAKALLIPIDAHLVELPREVGLALRHRPLGEVAPQAPAIDSLPRTPAELDRLGTTAALETVRLVEALGEAWTAKPPPVLRSGGVGVRDLRRTARELGVDEARAALVTETAYAAGLVAATHGIEPVYLPTGEFDAWLRRDTAQRWTELAAAWLGMTRQPSVVGQRGDRDRLITALGPDAERGTVPALRTLVLAVLGTLPPGAAPVDQEAVLARLTWQTPRRAKAQRPLAAGILAEADLLGVTAAGGLTGYSRTLLHGARPVAEQVLAGALPEPVDHFVVQPDLTIVVPGPPTAALGRELALTADLESTGGASVYRVGEASLRRALDADRSAADVMRFLTEHSRTPLPQALTYLIEDLARRHGVLRAGAAASYLRCADEPLLTRVLADRGVESLQLRRLAPTVLISTAPPTRVLDELRAAGYAPAGETADGAVVTLGAEPPRAPSRAPARGSRDRAGADPSAHLGELVRRIRSGDALSTLSQRVNPIAQQIPGVTSATTMGLLREAIRAGHRIWLGYASPDGTASRHTILPISMAGGMVRGHESATRRLQSFSLHRITAVSVLDDEDEAGAGQEPR